MISDDTLMVYLLSFIVILLALLGLGLGVLAGREPIRGSCGGLGGSACSSCHNPCPRRRPPEEKS